MTAVLQVLHLLHSQEAAVRSLNFACYKTPIFQFQALSFSERFLLMNVLNKFPQVSAGLWLVEAGHVTAELTSDWRSCGSSASPTWRMTTCWPSWAAAAAPCWSTSTCTAAGR